MVRRKPRGSTWVSGSSLQSPGYYPKTNQCISQIDPESVSILAECSALCRSHRSERGRNASGRAVRPASNPYQDFPIAGGLPMRPHGQTKLGFFPLPLAEAQRLRNWLLFPERFSAIDPCVGVAGAFSHLLRHVRTHG